jgi:hypothetical protein
MTATSKPAIVEIAFPGARRDILLLYQFLEELAMTKLVAFALMVSTLLFHAAKADTTKDFVRLACVPEAGLLDVEYRNLHDSVAGDPKGPAERNAILARQGFHDPHGLKFSCELGGVTYFISAEQDPTTERMCGGAPEVFLTVTRGGKKFFTDVVFGESCNGLPSVMRFSVGDGPKSWRGRETQVCYSTGKETDPVFCDWTFGNGANFDKRFPIDGQRLQRIVSHQERR